MAGVSDDVELEDAIGLASFQIMTGRVPAPGQWVDAIIDAAKADAMESFF
jgi:hypothetical protein